MKTPQIWLAGVALVCAGCIESADGDAGDGGPPDAGADMHVDDGAHFGGAHFAHAFVHPTCGYDDQPSVIVTLAQHAACDLGADTPQRVQLYLDENADLPFPIRAPIRLQIGPGSPMNGVYYDANGDGAPITGTLTFDAFNMHGAVAGTYDLQPEGSAPLAGEFGARVCPAESAFFDPPPDCYPYDDGPPPIAPGPRNTVYPSATAQPICGPGGAPSLALTLGAHDSCDPGPPGPGRAQLYFDAHPDLLFPIRAPRVLPVAPGTPVRGLYFDEQGVAHQLIGEVELERFALEDALYAQYDLRAADGTRISDAMKADICISADAWNTPGSDCYPYGREGPPGPRPVEPEPEPAPEPDVGEPEPEHRPAGRPIPIEPVEPGDHCEGHYTITEWAITEINFSPFYINEMLSSGLMGGSIVMDVVARADTVELVDATILPGGVRARAPESPVYPRMPIIWRADGFDTPDEGVFGVWLTESQYPRFEPLNWELEGVMLAADAAADCQTLTITHTGWFTDLGFSLGGQDFDEDGDGRMDGWTLTTQMTAERL